MWCRRSLADRGLRGTRPIIGDDHKGLKAAAAKVLGATVQRCRVHFMRNALAGVGKKDRPIVTAALRTAFDQDTLTAPKDHWAKLIDAFEPRVQKLAELMRHTGNRRRQLRHCTHGPGDYRRAVTAAEPGPKSIVAPFLGTLSQGGIRWPTPSMGQTRTRCGD
uniref:transposase n=1 Tax=Cribrihabitans marinus TaxID=1227549 RepID=UPI003570F9B8